MYQLSFEAPIEYLDSVRALLGVTVDELSDDTIMTLAIVGQAEQDLLMLAPTAGDILENQSTPDNIINKVMIAFVNLIAFYAYGSLKISLLLSETDNKTTATRFKGALSRDPNEFKVSAIKLLINMGIAVSTGTPDLLSFSVPQTDIITGDINVR
jgi:hypothetical protein